MANSINMAYGFPKEIEKAKAERWPVLIPCGTMEYHSQHCAFGCDTLVAKGIIEKIAERRDVVVMPPVWYGVASYAVAGPDKNTIHVDCDTFEAYMYCIFKSMIYGGWRNIYVVIAHQGEDYMPMTLACMKAAKKLTMEYLEQTLGVGWWGSPEQSNFYETFRNDDSPWNWIRVLFRGSDRIGGDHAGMKECSILKLLYPEAVKEERIPEAQEWFTKTAKDMSSELGEQILKDSLEKYMGIIDFHEDRTEA